MGEMIDFKSNGGTTPGYLALPDGSGPGVVVLQEWWGLNDDIMEIADRFAQAGFVALAPDMYHGNVASEPDDARKYAMELQLDQAARDLSGAVDYLLAQEKVLPKKVGSVGFCMGGALSLYLATLRDTNAAVTYYGAPRYDEFSPEKVKAPVLAHFAGEDPDTTQRGQEQVQKMKAAGKRAEVHVYPGAHHSFFNKTRPEAHNAEAAEESWRRTLQFFKRNLQEA